MTKTIFIVDYIGTHSGMDYYLESFREVLSGIDGWRVELLSNWTDRSGEKPFFENQYKGNILRKGFSLLRNLRRLHLFVKSHKEDVFVYLTYGNQIDLYFMNTIMSAKHHLIDIHEGIAQNIDDNQMLLRKFKKLYGEKIQNVISHSGRTDSFLTLYEYKGRTFRVPHFKYVFPKSYDSQQISREIKESIDTTRINLLFFGNLNKSKGVDILLDAVNRLEPEIADRLNLIIAGKDFDGSAWEIKPAADRNVHIFARHITDDELRYLYQSVDYLCLPYRKTSQSGILEMAFYFKKPIIASSLPYFEKTLGEFPSFGLLAGNGAEDYTRTLAKLVDDSSRERPEFFTEEDYSRYENRREIEEFKKDIKSWLRERQ